MKLVYEPVKFENPFEMQLDSTGDERQFVELPLRAQYQK